MVVPWLAVGKLVLSNLDTIVGVARPLFTRKKPDVQPAPADLVSQQIAELQAASSGNAERIQALATQLKQVVTALDEAALTVAVERAKTRRLAIAAIAISVLSLVAIIVLVVAR